MAQRVYSRELVVYTLDRANNLQSLEKQQVPHESLIESLYPLFSCQSERRRPFDGAQMLAGIISSLRDRRVLLTALEVY